MRYGRGLRASARFFEIMPARFFAFGLILTASANLMASETAYRLWIESSVEGRTLTVAPHMTGPAGTHLRYQITSSKLGASGKSSTSQSGQFPLDEKGSRPLATLKLGVDADDRYSIAVKVFDGAKMVAEQTLNYPQ
jgi:hypothetical protein